MQYVTCALISFRRSATDRGRNCGSQLSDGGGGLETRLKADGRSRHRMRRSKIPCFDLSTQSFAGACVHWHVNVDANEPQNGFCIGRHLPHSVSLLDIFLAPVPTLWLKLRERDLVGLRRSACMFMRSRHSRYWSPRSGFMTKCVRLGGLMICKNSFNFVKNAAFHDFLNVHLKKKNVDIARIRTCV